MFLAIVGLVLAPSRGTSAQSIPRRLPIVDEASQDPSLKETRDGLLQAARSGHLETVWTFVDPDVRATYENKRGIEQLKREWEIDSSPTRFLDELALVLSLGGRFESPERTSFVAPSFFIDYPDVTSMGSHGVVIHRDSPVYERPDIRSTVFARAVRGDVLPMLLAFRGWVQGWVQVTLPDKRKGYMLERDLRSPSETRAYFSKVHGRWMLTGFYGGVD